MARKKKKKKEVISYIDKYGCYREKSANIPFTRVCSDGKIRTSEIKRLIYRKRKNKPNIFKTMQTKNPKKWTFKSKIKPSTSSNILTSSIKSGYETNPRKH